MATFEVTATWGDPITLSQREIFQVQTGRLVYIAFGATPPAHVLDGAVIRDEQLLILEPGQTVQFRTRSGTATVYRGAFA